MTVQRGYVSEYQLLEVATVLEKWCFHALLVWISRSICLATAAGCRMVDLPPAGLLAFLKTHQPKTKPNQTWSLYLTLVWRRVQDPSVCYHYFCKEVDKHWPLPTVLIAHRPWKCCYKSLVSKQVQRDVRLKRFHQESAALWISISSRDFAVIIKTSTLEKGCESFAVCLHFVCFPWEEVHC